MMKSLVVSDGSSIIAHEVPSPISTATTFRSSPRATMLRLSPTSPGSSPSSDVPSFPSLPSAPLPQQARLESSRIAQVISSPPAMAVAVLSVGRLTRPRFSPISPASSPMSSVLPIPSWPWSLCPQHDILPSSHRTQVCESPRAIWAKPSPLSGRSTCGSAPLKRSAAVSPIVSVEFSPSWPYPFWPQQTRESEVPSFTMAQAWFSPAAMAVAFQ